MKKNYSRFTPCLFFVILILLSACTQPTATPMAYPTPLPENTTVVGRVVNTSDEPYAELTIRLAEVYYSDEDPTEGAYVLDTAFSPSAVTDQDGNFIFENITVMDYVLVLGNPDSAYKIIEDDNAKAKVWKTEAGKVLDVGEIKLDFDFTP
ncbi:MAG: hypothetical protein WA110_01420 [Anaerolineaceae bacterium]